MGYNSSSAQLPLRGEERLVVTASINRLKPTDKELGAIYLDTLGDNLIVASISNNNFFCFGKLLLDLQDKP